LASCCFGGGTGSAAADDVGVYVGNPRIAKYVEAAELLRGQLPAAQARWNQVAATGATFTIAVQAAGARDRVAQPCDGVPITVRVEQGRLTSATYAQSTAHCTAGTAVKATDNPFVYSVLSPSALFQEVGAQIERGVQGQACIDGSFDDDYGLPTDFHEACPWVKDADWRIQISDIVSTRQRFVNLVITLAGGVLGLLVLAYYQYRRVRRRQEAMPELLLR